MQVEHRESVHEQVEEEEEEEEEESPLEGPPIWTVHLGLTGDQGSGFHTRNDPAQPHQRTNYIERKGAVDVRCSCVDVMHGLLDSDSDTLCTLLVLEFRFDPRKQARRISSVDVELRFDGANCPEVSAIAPCGNFSVAPTRQSESTKFWTNAGFSATPAPAPTLNASVGYDRSITRDLTYAATVTGATALRGRNYGRANCASWTLLENPATKTGVPVAMKTAILLKRSDEEPFQCEVAIKARADWRSNLEALFGRTPADDPVLFDPTMDATSAEYDAKRLGGVDLENLASITFQHVVKGNGEIKMSAARVQGQSVGHGSNDVAAS